ncbi:MULTISPECIES: hypothetical protein [unclassified Nocardia]|uniref:hypothetical protein n=1 Tax=unclassified Nocardia TaxID=2637762 RepID=UPI00278C64FA|nr:MULTISPECIES: hypothetical protein [unclassified Nocardia]
MNHRTSWSLAGELVATGIAILAAGVGGAGLFALSATERWSFRDLLLHIGIPATIVLLLVLAAATVLRWRRLARGIVAGAAAGAAATLGLEAVRITGFRVFHTMPGDLPTLMGVKATDRIMVGPDTASRMIGYLDHYWNGALLGIVFALVVGGFPVRRGWIAPLLGMAYGLATGYGFLTGPVPRSLGVGGVFSTVDVGEFRFTVYLAHAVFGLLVGLLVHRFAAKFPPLWTFVWELLGPTPAERR